MLCHFADPWRLVKETDKLLYIQTEAKKISRSLEEKKKQSSTVSLKTESFVVCSKFSARSPESLD